MFSLFTYLFILKAEIRNISALRVRGLQLKLVLGMMFFTFFLPLCDTSGKVPSIWKTRAEQQKVPILIWSTFVKRKKMGKSPELEKVNSLFLTTIHCSFSHSPWSSRQLRNNYGLQKYQRLCLGLATYRSNGRPCERTSEHFSNLLALKVQWGDRAAYPHPTYQPI